MNARLLMAALLGGLAIFFWGFVSHMLLPLGTVGMGVATNEEAAIGALKESLPAQEGIYIIPGLAPDKYEDPAAVAAYSAKALANPSAFVVYQPVGHDGMEMTGNLGKELAANIVSALLLAVLFGLTGGGLGRRLGVAAIVGLSASLATHVPYWNWYRFPLDFTIAAIAQTVVGALLAALVISMVLGRTTR